MGQVQDFTRELKKKHEVAETPAGTIRCRLVGINLGAATFAGQQPPFGVVQTAALVAPRSTPACVRRANTRLFAGSNGMDPDA